MRNGRVNRTKGFTHTEHGTCAIGKVCAAPGAVPVCGKVKQHNTKPGAAQRFNERRHEGRFARPAVHEDCRAAALLVWLKHVALHHPGRCCDLLPFRVAQMVARTLRQIMMIARAILGLFRRAKQAKRLVSGFGRRQMTKFALTAYLRAADMVRAFLSFVSSHGLRGRLTARSFS